jgi:photosystem II stability/assembly factor-like uncharacterized protein
MKNMKRDAGLISMAVLLLGQLACSGPKAPGSWAALDTGVGNAFYRANFVDDQVGWLNGQSDRSFESPDANANSNGNANSNTRVQKPGKPPEDPLKANEGFEVMQTTDGGVTWKQIPNQFQHKIRSVWFVDPAKGWALTIDRNILATNDGGATWALQRKAGTIKLKLIGNRRDPLIDQPDQIEHIYFLDAVHGWAWGGGKKSDYTEQPGIFLMTADGGQNWREVPFPFAQNIYSIFFLDANNAWASSEGDGFYRTTDGGMNWSKIETKQPEDVYRSIFFLDQNHGWTVGRSGRIARTNDGGRTWQRMYSIRREFEMWDIFFTDSQNGWVVGEDGAILYTPDSGETWLSVSSEVATDLLDVVFTKSGAGWAAGLGGALVKFESSGG